MNLSTRRLAILISLLIVTPLGFASKFYSGPGAWWFNNYSGGIMYEIFWCLFFAWLCRHTSTFQIAFWVFLITCALESLQLWHPPFLECIRASFLGRALIGTTFSWLDFPHYLVGCLLGLYWMRWARHDSI